MKSRKTRWNGKRILSILLACALLFSGMELPAMAAETQEQPGVKGDADQPGSFVAGEEQAGTPDAESEENQEETSAEEDGENQEETPAEEDGENQEETPAEEDGENQAETPNAEENIEGEEQTDVPVTEGQPEGAGENEDGAAKVPFEGEDSQIAVTLSGIEISDKVYDGEAATYIGTPVVRDASSEEELSTVSVAAVYAGTLVNGDAYEETETAPAQAGSYTLTFTLAGAEADQYALQGTAVYPFEIRQREVTVTADSVTVTIGSQLPELSALTYQVEGLLEEDTLSKEPSLRYSQRAIPTDITGTYEIIPYGAEAGNNYSVTYVNGTLNVEAGEILGSGTVNGLSWEIDGHGKLTIEGNGDYAAKQNNPVLPPWTEWDYARYIKSAEVRVTGMSYTANMFKDCSKLQSVDLSGLDMSKVTDMSEMFSCCSSLQSVDLSGLDTSKVTDMGSMFWLCGSLRSVNLSGFDTRNVTSMGCMFYGCSSLRSLDLSGFDTRNVTSMNGMFEGCSSLQSLDLSGFNTRNVIYIDNMFESCSSLRSLNLCSFDTRKVEDGMGRMFDGCSSLQSLDLSSFDLQGIRAYISLYGCASLSYIRTPKNCNADGLWLPGNGTWYDMEGKEYTGQLPALRDSIELFKGGYPGDGTMGAYVRVSGVAMAGKTYDGTPCAYTGTAAAVDADSSPIDGVTLTASYSGTLADGTDYPATAEAPSQAGEYTLSFTVAGTDAEQYSLYQSEYRFRIDQRQVTITAPGRAILIGEQLPDLSEADDYTVEGLITGEQLIKEPMLQYGKKDIPTDRPGMYAIAPYGAEAGANYRIKYVEAALTVGAADGYDLSEAKISFPDIEYDGIQHPVTPDVQYQDWTLREGTDYRLEVLPADGVERIGSYYMVQQVGRYTIRITGRGAYCGEKKAAFHVLPAEENPDGNIRLNRYSLFMQPGDTERLTAAALPENIQIEAFWDSSNETVATVNDAGEVTAKAEGITYITAEYNGETARARVEVEPAEAGDKLLDLSGDIWVAGFKRESEDFVYTGQKITQDIRVYYKNTLLTEKTDYTLTYKNNINAAVYNNTVKAPSVTINLKGQYSGSVTLYYTIHPLDINTIDIYNADNGGSDGTGAVGSRSPGYEQTVAYNSNLKIPNPVLAFGKKKLAANKDFVCDYTILQEELERDQQDGHTADYKKGDSYTPGKVYCYTVNGIGNFTGSFRMQLVVLKDKTFNFSSASVKLDQKQYEYHGTALSKSEVKIAELKVSGQVLDGALYDYEVCANGTEGAYVTVYPSEAGRAAGYRGSKKVNLKLIGDRKIADASLGENWKDSIPFSQKTVNKNGGIYQENSGVLVYGEGEVKETLAEGEDYTVKYSNAKKAGKVTVTFTGKGRYKGTLKKKYEITPNSDAANLKVEWDEKTVTVKEDGTLETVYQKGGAIPGFVIKDQDRNILKNKTDYTVKYKDNKNPGTTMICEIAGKGNYKGYTQTIQLQVIPGDISLASISIPDKPYSTKQNAWKSTAVIKDVNGKKLAAGTDYVKELTYTYENMASGQPPQKGAAVTVTVQGIGCYEGSVLEGSYRIFENNISKLKVVIDPQEYTGEEVTLSPGDIHVYANSTDAKKEQNELPSSCYEIVGYSNNIKSGTAKVTLRGKEEYGGTKTYSFKIQKRAYRINRVKGIAFDKTSLALLLAEQDEAKRTITATITAQTEEPIANPTVIWTVSDRGIADIETRIIDDTKISVAIMLKKEGNVTITATTQDGNKKAQCKVKIVDAPILKQEGQKIEGEVGQTAQLELEKAEWQEIDVDAIKWESNNPDVVSVTKDGLLAKLTMKRLGAAVIKVTYHGYVQQCYAIVIGEETLPEGRALKYNQQPGCTDDTPYINKLLRDWEWDYPDAYDYMYLPAGVYWIDPTDGGYDQFGKYKFGGIILTDNQKLIMSPSALLMTIPNSKDGYHVIWAFGRDNITISGGQIIGDRKGHKGSGGEWGHGIQISGCTNVTIENVEISHCWGDGIYLGEYGGVQSNHVTITKCNLHHNRRSNLSITDASNVKVQDCQFNNANGTAPQYGIDIEPNSGYTCQNVTISNCSFKGNAGGTIQILGQLNGHIKNVTIENCVGDKEPVTWSGFGGSVSGVTQRNNKWG